MYCPMQNITAITGSVISHGHGSTIYIGYRKNNVPFDSRTCYVSGGLTIFLFLSNAMSVQVVDSVFTNNIAYEGGGVYVPVLTQVWSLRRLRTISNIVIENCKFQENKAFFKGGAISVNYRHTKHKRFAMILSHDTGQTWLIVRNCKFLHNEGVEGGAVYLYIAADNHYSIAKFRIAGSMFIYNSATYGGAIFMSSHFTVEQVTISHGYKYKLKIFVATNLVFYSNWAKSEGGAVYSLINGDNLEEGPIRLINMEIILCHFKNNSAVRGSSISARATQYYNYIKIYRSNFSENHSPKPTIGDHVGGSVISLENVHNLVLEDITISNNTCRGVYANMSAVSIEGQVWIINNTANHGAGLFLDFHPTNFIDKTSKIVLNSGDSSYYFRNIYYNLSSVLYLTANRALEYGGGIAVKEGCRVSSSCFFSLESPKLKEKISSHIVMKQNTAGIAGDSIYGGNLETCRIKELIPGPIIVNSVLPPVHFWTFFDINEVYIPSAVASEPYMVCICRSNVTCDTSYQVDVFPGQLFRVPVVSLGQYNYSAPSVIRAHILSHEQQFSTALEDIWTTQSVGKICKNLSYSINALVQSSYLTLRLAIEDYALEYISLPEKTGADVEVFIRECPFGFVLDTVSKKCNCTHLLKKQGVVCDIDSQTLHKPPSMWIGNVSGVVIAHDQCPLDYCNKNVLNIDPYNQQEQCDFRRSGILCGACRPGLSLALGTSQCMECSNIYLLLLIPFALAGVVLIIILLKCNLTVATGTINGLILYANILQANHSVFFTLNQKKLPMYILSVFIAWLNLDLGIQVCFSESLNAHTKMWLQFVFPLYIWLLVGLLILVSKYSITVSRLTGTNTVQVLATLFILSYAKILRATFNTFSSLTVTDNNGNDTVVWLLDGNFNFLKWPHISLFLMGTIMLTLHILPFTIVVLLSPCLQAHSNFKPLCWVTKLKPLLDTYGGPYKTKYRSWTGLMLLFRLILFSIFSGNVSGDPSVNLLAILIAISLLLVIWIKVGRVYRNRLLNLLELFFLENMLVFAAASLYLRSFFGTLTQTLGQNILVYLMIGSALIAFICILAYHCFVQLKQSRQTRSVLEKVKHTLMKYKRHKQEDQASIVNEISVQSTTQTFPTMTVVELEESLLQQN